GLGAWQGGAVRVWRYLLENLPNQIRVIFVDGSFRGAAAHLQQLRPTTILRCKWSRAVGAAPAERLLNEPRVVQHGLASDAAHVDLFPKPERSSPRGKKGPKPIGQRTMDLPVSIQILDQASGDHLAGGRCPRWICRTEADQYQRQLSVQHLLPPAAHSTFRQALRLRRRPGD